MSTPDEADHVLITYDPARSCDEQAEVRKVYGPMTEANANALAEVVKQVAGGFYYEVKPIEKPPLMLTDAGRRLSRST